MLNAFHQSISINEVIKASSHMDILLQGQFPVYRPHSQTGSKSETSQRL